eukprot:jgi/Mesvir1/16151/Mv08422-RA.1
MPKPRSRPREDTSGFGGFLPEVPLPRYVRQRPSASDLDVPIQQQTDARTRGDEATPSGATDNQFFLREEDDPEDVFSSLCAVPSDIMACLTLLRQQFPPLSSVSVPPLILCTQVYSVLGDRTTADRDMEELRHQGRLRRFKLSSGKSDYAVVFTDDYVQQVLREKARAVAKGTSALQQDAAAVFDWFISCVLPQCTDVSISEDELARLLTHAQGDAPVSRDGVLMLLRHGLLVRQLAGTGLYWFGIPNIGQVLKSIIQGRHEVIGLVSKRRRKEILQAELEKKPLHQSVLGMRFHLRDLLGSCTLDKKATTVGNLLRLHH